MIVSRDIRPGLILRKIGPELLALFVYDIVVTASYVFGGLHWLAVKELPLPLFGTALALIATLRNNAAYARWWEARTLWGAVVNTSRSLALAVIGAVADRREQETMLRLQIAYVRALRLHLLKQPAWDEIASFLPQPPDPALREANNLPFAIQRLLAERLRALERAGRLDTIQWSAVLATTKGLMDAQGGMERIKNTPLPRHYLHLLKVGVTLFCLLLPLGLIADMGLFTPVGSSLIGAIFVVLHRIGGDLEDPFENTVHDVPMLSISRTIEIDMLQSIGPDNVPRPIGVEEGVLT